MASSLGTALEMVFLLKTISMAYPADAPPSAEYEARCAEADAFYAKMDAEQPASLLDFFKPGALTVR